MKTKYLIGIGLFGAVILGVSLQVFAQEEKAASYRTSKRISESDKAAIKEIFKDVDPSKYQLRFSDVQGEKKITMREIEQVKKIRNPGEAAGLVILIVSDDGIVYIVAASQTLRDLEGLLGKEKTARLNQITAKFAR